MPSNLGWNYFNCVLKSGKTLNGSVEGAFSEQVDYLYKGRKSSSTKARQVGTSENSPVGLMRGKKRGWRSTQSKEYYKFIKSVEVTKCRVSSDVEEGNNVGE